MSAEQSVRDRAAEVVREGLARGLYSEYLDELPYSAAARRIADALAAAGLLAGEVEVETVVIHEHQWVSQRTYEDGPNRDPQRCIGGCGQTRVLVTECPEEPMNPDCRSGNKHKACSGTAWDDDADALTDCSCACHREGA